MTDAASRARLGINQLCAQGSISIKTANWGRDIIAEVFTPDTVYCSIAPDGGDLTFYWKAGEWSLGIDLQTLSATASARGAVLPQCKSWRGQHG